MGRNILALNHKKHILYKIHNLYISLDQYNTSINNFPLRTGLQVVMLLFASIPGQEFELIPYQGTEFTLKGMTGFSIAFKQDENKRYSEAMVTGPNMVSIAKRKG
jgi:hypothetical protein